MYTDDMKQKFSSIVDGDSEYPASIENHNLLEIIANKARVELEQLEKDEKENTKRVYENSL